MPVSDYYTIAAAGNHPEFRYFTGLFLPAYPVFTNVADCLKSHIFYRKSGKEREVPAVYIYAPKEHVRFTAEDIEAEYTRRLKGVYGYGFPFFEIQEALKPLNEVLETLPPVYECVGRVIESDVEDIWKGLPDVHL